MCVFPLVCGVFLKKKEIKTNSLSWDNKKNTETRSILSAMFFL